MGGGLSEDVHLAPALKDMHSWKSHPGPSRPGSQPTATAPCDQAAGSTLHLTHPTDSEQCRPGLRVELPTLSDSFLWA